jgi:hypothetical protein
MAIVLRDSSTYVMGEDYLKQGHTDDFAYSIDLKSTINSRFDIMQIYEDAGEQCEDLSIKQTWAVTPGGFRKLLWERKNES